MVGDVAAPVGAHHLGAQGLGVDEEVVEGAAGAQGDDVGVLQQQQVVVGRVSEEPPLEGVRVGVGHPPQPPDAQHYSSASQSRVSMISRSRARNATA